MNAWSESALALIESCPLSFTLRKRKTPPLRPEILEIGSLAHQAIEKYVERCVYSGLPQDAAIVDECVAGIWRDDELPIPPTWRIEVAQLLETFVSFYVVSYDGEAITEGEFAFDEKWNRVDWWDDRVRFRAKLDFLVVNSQTARASITDWKTGYRLPSRKEAENEPQLRTYGFVVSKVFPEAEFIEVSYCYVRHRYEVDFELDPDEIRAHGEELERRMERADSLVGSTKASPGPGCERCMYRLACPDYQRIGQTKAIPEETADLVAFWYLLRARLADVEEAVRARIETEGSFELPDGKILSFYPVESWTIDSSYEAIHELLAKGIPPVKIYDEIRLSKSAVDRLLKVLWKKGKERAAALDGFLRGFASRSVSTRLEARKR